MGAWGRKSIVSISLCFLSSVLYILSFPNWNLPYLAWIALVPLSFISISSHSSALDAPNAPNVSTSPRRIFLLGWLSGTLAYGGLLSWLIDTFQAAHLSLSLSVPCLIALSAYLGLFWGAWTWLLNKTSSPVGTGRGPINIFIGAAAWVALEYLRTYLFSGFPWVLLADSQVHNLPIIQIASLTGCYGVSFLVVLFNLAVSRLLYKGCHPEQSEGSRSVQGKILRLYKWPQNDSILAFGIFLTFYFYGYWTFTHPDAPTPPRPHVVALLQGNIDQYKKWDQAYVEEIKERYAGLVSQAVLTKPDVMIWPETSVPGYLLQDPPLREWLTNVVRQSKTNHLIGSPHYENKNSYNSSFSINPEGKVEGQYSKKHLVPFGEIVPWSNVLGRWVSELNALGGFTAGQESPVLSAGPIKLGVNICYEAIFPNLVRQSVKAGAEAVVNITNDGWYMKTAAPYQHLAPNVFRAIENRRWVLRANNTGVSAIIDPYGRITQASPIFEPAIVTGQIVPLHHQTVYTRFGDVFSWACLLLCGIFGARAILRRS